MVESGKHILKVHHSCVAVPPAHSAGIPATSVNSEAAPYRPLIDVRDTGEFPLVRLYVRTRTECRIFRAAAYEAPNQRASNWIFAPRMSSAQALQSAFLLLSSRRATHCKGDSDADTLDINQRQTACSCPRGVRCPNAASSRLCAQHTLRRRLEGQYLFRPAPFVRRTPTTHVIYVHAARPGIDSK